MGREPVDEDRAAGGDEVQVSECCGRRRTGEAVAGGRGDLGEGACETGGVAGELDGGGVGEELALASGGGLERAGEEKPGEADGNHEQADGGEDEQRRGAGCGFVGLGVGAFRPAGAEDIDTELGDEEQAGEKGDEACVERSVAVEKMAELVGDDALELVASEAVEAAACEDEDGVVGAAAAA
jgi:hypothetical protein